MSTVILFGAGASICAGYPRANDLLPKIEAYSVDTPLLGPGNDWSTWTDFRDSEQADKLLEYLLTATNPEIVLSALDLLSAAQDDSSRSLFSIVAALARGESYHPERYEESKRRLGNKPVGAALAARRALLRCLEHFLIDKSWDESDNPEKRNYLREVFHQLGFGDTVITFNWDMTAERTLGEMGLWNPTTGYGFEKGLIRRSVESPDTVNNELLPSPVRVLKLHGSVGWKRPWLDSEQIYLDNVYLLKHLPVSLPGEDGSVTFTDPDFDQINHDDAVIVAPTFLKAVPAGKDMQRIWFLASKALTTASRILVWGYSLPPSDAAARVLLNPLRFRLTEGNVEIIVTDPSGEVRDRWDEFLGYEVSRNGRLGE